MAEESKDEGLMFGRYDRHLPVLTLITGAAGIIGIVFACLDWSHASLAVLRSHSFPLILFLFALASLFLTYLMGLYLITHDRRRIWHTVAEAAALIIMGAIAAYVI